MHDVKPLAKESERSVVLGILAPLQGMQAGEHVYARKRQKSTSDPPDLELRVF